MEFRRVLFRSSTVTGYSNIEDLGNGTTRVMTDTDSDFNPTASSRFLDQTEVTGTQITHVTEYTDSTFSTVTGSSTIEVLGTGTTRVMTDTDSDFNPTASSRFLD